MLKQEVQGLQVVQPLLDQSRRGSFWQTSDERKERKRGSQGRRNQQWGWSWWNRGCEGREGHGWSQCLALRWGGCRGERASRECGWRGGSPGSRGRPQS